MDKLTYKVSEIFLWW